MILLAHEKVINMIQKRGEEVYILGKKKKESKVQELWKTENGEEV